MSEQGIYNYIAALPDNSPGIALELGANHGIFTDLIASKFSQCYAFECEKHNMDILKQNCKAHNIEFVDKAVGIVNGVTKLYLCGPNMGGHSTCESHPGFGGWGHSFENYVRVPSITLDKFTRGMRVKFIKCDIEGAEKFIFSKATEMLLKNDLTLILEVHKTVDIERLYDFFTIDMRYNVYTVDDLQRADLFGYDIHYIITNDPTEIKHLESKQKPFE